ncbi:MAG: flagellar hook-length control protein FliK [Deltaproteobacteria bacterium]|nr:flagellar hook-length control protein FliK [Deltaproteobacteria bacterium]
MTDFNLVNLKQDSSLSDASEKLRKGKTGKKTEQMMPFVCVIGNACRATTQKTVGIPPDLRHGKGKIGACSNKGNAIRQGGVFNINPENNILIAGKNRTEKTNQLLNNILGAGKGKTEKMNQLLPVKGKGTKTNRLFSGKIDLLSKRVNKKQTGGKVKNLQGSSGSKKSKVGKDEIRDQKSEVRGQKLEVRVQGAGSREQKLEVGEQRAKTEDAHELLKFGLKNADAVKGKTVVGQNFKTGKIDVAVSREGAFRESWVRINNVLVGGQRVKNRGQRSEARSQKSEVRGRKATMKDATGRLKSSLKNAVAMKGKIAVETDKTEKNPFILTKNDNCKNEIKDILRHSGLKSEETMEILHRKISLSSYSSTHLDKISSAVGYHHTFSSGSSAVVNESVNSSGIEPHVLINQITSVAKRSGRVRIMLNPPRLGTLDVDVLVRDNKVHVILRAENNDVRQILQSNIESLKSSLRNHGLVADSINISAQEKSDGADHGADYRPGQNETLFKEGGNREGNQEDHGGERDFLNNDSSLFEEENPRIFSDGRVSLFA